MKVLVAGGAGYIGSTICAALEERGLMPVVLDSLVTGQEVFTKGRIFYKGDIADTALLGKIFAEHRDIASTIHCAALIVVPESAEKPAEYYTENVSKSVVLLRELGKLGCQRVVFSSSASIYSVVPGFMVNERSPLAPQSPYARTKFMMEMVLADYAAAYGTKALALRYFNPIGADPKFRSGIHVREPSHVVGKMVDVAVGRLKEFVITGTDWPTRDGTGIRDYIHVWDLARAHVEAVVRFDDVFGSPFDTSPVPAGSFAPDSTTYRVINLGTGRGSTVRELLNAFETVYGKRLPVREAPPRPGDVAGAYAKADTATKLLGWKAELPLEKGISDALEWGKRRKWVLGYG